MFTRWYKEVHISPHISWMVVFKALVFGPSLTGLQAAFAMSTHRKMRTTTVT